MRLKESVVISAPQPAVWDYVSDLDNYLHFMSGITRWEAGRAALGPRRPPPDADPRRLAEVGA